MLLESVLNHQCATLFAVYLQKLDDAGESVYRSFENTLRKILLIYVGLRYQDFSTMLPRLHVNSSSMEVAKEMETTLKLWSSAMQDVEVSNTIIEPPKACTLIAELSVEISRLWSI